MKIFNKLKDFTPTQTVVALVAIAVIVVCFIFAPDFTKGAIDGVNNFIEAVEPDVEVNTYLIEGIELSDMVKLNINSNFSLPKVSFEETVSGLATIDISVPFVIIALVILLIGVALACVSPIFAYIFVVVFALISLYISALTSRAYTNFIDKGISSMIVVAISCVIVGLSIFPILFIADRGKNYYWARNDVIYIHIPTERADKPKWINDIWWATKTTCTDLFIVAIVYLFIPGCIWMATNNPLWLCLTPVLALNTAFSSIASFKSYTDRD